MNETNGPGAVVPDGAEWNLHGVYYKGRWPNMLIWDRIEDCEPKRWIKAVGANEKYLDPLPAPAPPQPAPGSDAERVQIDREEWKAIRSFVASMAKIRHQHKGMSGEVAHLTQCLEMLVLADEEPAAPPQESDKGRDDEEISLEDLPAHISGLQERITALEGELSVAKLAATRHDSERRAALRQLAEARAEVEALREEVALTNEHEHQILQERNEARDELAEARAALLAYQEVEPCAWIVETPNENVIYWTRAKRELAEQVAARYGREAIPLYRHPPRPATADVVTPSPAPELADLLRKRYPRLLERGNPLYDGALAAAVERAGAADAVTVPREEWEEYQTAKTGFRFAKGWAMICTEDLNALRSSAQAGEGGAG